jgi:hypothetical protein
MKVDVLRPDRVAAGLDLDTVVVHLADVLELHSGEPERWERRHADERVSRLLGVPGELERDAIVESEASRPASISSPISGLRSTLPRFCGVSVGVPPAPVSGAYVRSAAKASGCWPAFPHALRSLE